MSSDAPVLVRVYKQSLLRQFRAGGGTVTWILKRGRDAHGQEWRWKSAHMVTPFGEYERIADWDYERWRDGAWEPSKNLS
jgi:hypothetical protein